MQKNWKISEKEAFVKILIEQQIIDPEDAKLTFEIFIDDCTGNIKKWYTVNPGVILGTFRNVASMARRGGKSQKRRVIRRRRSTSRRSGHKTRRSSK